MREIKYLSPTSLSIFEEDRTRFYLLYLADKKAPREPQTAPMAIGSAFDAYVKNYLHEKLFGAGSDARFDLNTLFEAQVEPHNRDKARVAGEYVFKTYKASGALIDMLTDLNGSVTTPRFEFDLMGIVQKNFEGNIPLLGKPDLYYTNKNGARVIHDWKVNGYYSKTGVSPVPGYVRLREVGKSYLTHKNCFPMNWKGIILNQAQTLDMTKVEWAQQLSIYMWLCGEEVGTDECVASIDQIVCRPGGLRFAEHRSKITKSFQNSLFDRCKKAWEAITTGHFFDHLSREESQIKCKQLDNFVSDVMERPATSNEEWLRQCTRPY